MSMGVCGDSCDRFLRFEWCVTCGLSLGMVCRHMDAMHAVIEHTKQHLTASVERYPHTTEEVRRALDAMASQQRAFEAAAATAAQEEAAALRERVALEASQVRASITITSSKSLHSSLSRLP